MALDQSTAIHAIGVLLGVDRELRGWIETKPAEKGEA